ncbi:MAG: hypothetical protein MK193_12875 [Lentisphaeria bacterium]|nr:hypothetical protein [Lentisphaeria bacterium]
MYTLFISIAAGFISGLLASTTGMNWGWITFIGILVSIAIFALMSRSKYKGLKAIMESIQKLQQQAHGEANRLIHRAQSGQGGNPKVVQKQIETLMHNAAENMIKELDKAEPYFPWLLMSEKQISTSKAQLYYQLKQFEKADQYLAKSFVMDPLTACMLLARAYKKKDDKLDKMYKKFISRFKKDKGLMVYATYSWILFKQEKYTEAQEILATAKEQVSNNDGIVNNWEAIVNNKYKQFSNHFIGEQWYALHLEQPPQAKQQRAGKGALKNNPMYGGKGKRRFG